MRILLAVLPLSLAGCLKTYVVEMSDPAADAHYVLVQSSASGNSKVYDCLARPNGKDWDPTCVRAKMVSAPPNRASGE